MTIGRLVAGVWSVAQLAKKTGTGVDRIRRMTVWGNHSSTQYPDVFHAEVAGQKHVGRGLGSIVDLLLHDGGAVLLFLFHALDIDVVESLEVFLPVVIALESDPVTDR